MKTSVHSDDPHRLFLTSLRHDGIVTHTTTGGKFPATQVSHEQQEKYIIDLKNRNCVVMTWSCGNNSQLKSHQHCQGGKICLLVKKMDLWYLSKILFLNPRQNEHVSRLTTKPTRWHVHPAKTQISLGMCSVLSEYLLCAQWVAKDPRCPHADSEDSSSDWVVFARHTGHWFCHVAAHV